MTQHRVDLACLGALAVALVAGACGGSSSPPARATPGTSAASAVSPTTAASPISANGDQALASAALVGTDDLPYDWRDSHRKTNDDQATLADACGRTTQPGMTARAIGNDFLFDGLSPGLSEVVIVFASEDGASKSVDQATAYADCVVATLNAGKLKGGGAFSNAASEPLQLSGDAGEKTVAFQVHANERLEGASTDSMTQYTFLIGKNGRLVYELLVRGLGSPLEVDEASDFAASAAAKLR